MSASQSYGLYCRLVRSREEAYVKPLGVRRGRISHCVSFLGTFIGVGNDKRAVWNCVPYQWYVLSIVHIETNGQTPFVVN